MSSDLSSSKLFGSILSHRGFAGRRQTSVLVRIKRVFKWAVSEELISSGVHEALSTVTGLKFGRTSARESEPVKPVDDQTVELTLPYVTPQIAAMIRLAALTGMRPGEVIRMRRCDIDTKTDVWIYAPDSHKGRWRGHHRTIPLGPQAQELIEPFMNRSDDAYSCFHRPRLTSTATNAGQSNATARLPCIRANCEPGKSENNRPNHANPKDQKAASTRRTATAARLSTV
jgi:integrase